MAEAAQSLADALRAADPAALRMTRLGALMRAAAEAGDLARAGALAAERHALLLLIGTDAQWTPAAGHAAPEGSTPARRTLATLMQAERAADEALAAQLHARMQQQARQRADAARLRAATSVTGMATQAAAVRSGVD